MDTENVAHQGVATNASCNVDNQQFVVVVVVVVVVVAAYQAFAEVDLVGLVLEGDGDGDVAVLEQQYFHI